MHIGLIGCGDVGNPMRERATRFGVARAAWHADAVRGAGFARSADGREETDRTLTTVHVKDPT